MPVNYALASRQFFYSRTLTLHDMCSGLDAGDSLQMGRVAASLLNKQYRKPTEGGLLIGVFTREIILKLLVS